MKIMYDGLQNFASLPRPLFCELPPPSSLKTIELCEKKKTIIKKIQNAKVIKESSHGI